MIGAKLSSCLQCCPSSSSSLYGVRHPRKLRHFLCNGEGCFDGLLLAILNQLLLRLVLAEMIGLLVRGSLVGLHLCCRCGSGHTILRSLHLLRLGQRLHNGLQQRQNLLSRAELGRGRGNGRRGGRLLHGCRLRWLLFRWGDTAEEAEHVEGVSDALLTTIWLGVEQAGKDAYCYAF